MSLGELLDGCVDFHKGKSTVSIGVHFLEHLIHWHLCLGGKSEKGGSWFNNPPGSDSGGGGDEGSNSKGEFHFVLKLFLFFNYKNV